MLSQYRANVSVAGLTLSQRGSSVSCMLDSGQSFEVKNCWLASAGREWSERGKRQSGEADDTVLGRFSRGEEENRTFQVGNKRTPPA